ncbi:dienelactone hydrolase family protein [Herbivorax sp. ANBcel31]|uniref:alpha/beta hydrolase n=1 Tax=Herbivorax sp. ANBcel31 TaxID=3069754 RepID=UPI0027B6470D|nr:dienelactone hydrolase family protein [Herbivorax sp. ANBcel31]MDQ2085415.1 dienelactone hydrolase family protein [Herbivorax sp. ANBcel31]
MKYKTGCLIIHGFGATTSEVEPLSKYLKSKGFVTFCPSLKYSMENRKAFSNTSYSEWIQSAESSLKYLKSKCKDVVIIGFYMGGLIAANFAARFKIFSLITINTPIYYWNIKNIYYNILIDCRTGNFNNVKRYMKTPIEFSISELINFRLLIKKTKPVFSKVKVPMFIGQSLMDDAVQYRSAEYIYKKVSSNLKVLRCYDNLNRDLSNCSNSNLVFTDIEEFIKQVTKRENGIDKRLLPSFKYLDGTYN